MPIAVYGHYGFPLLLFPTAAADFEEYERFYLISAMRPWIDAGKVKVYTINSVNQYTWMAEGVHPAVKAERHEFYDAYVMNEVVPFIWEHQGGRAGIITSGASMGAYHAVNFLLRHPDVFDGTIAMSGAYDLSPWTGGWGNETIYFNSPLAYLRNLDDPWYLDRLRAKHQIHILTGQGPYEAPGQSKELAWLLHCKGIPHNLDLWGHDMSHDWPTWRSMMPLYLEHAF